MSDRDLYPFGALYPFAGDTGAQSPADDVCPGCLAQHEPDVDCDGIPVDADPMAGAIETINTLRQAVVEATSHAEFANNTARAIEAERLELVDELRQMREERDAYREALMQIAIDPEPDTREDMTDLALNVLTEHALAEMITARVEQAEAAFAARSAEA